MRRPPYHALVLKFETNMYTYSITYYTHTSTNTFILTLVTDFTFITVQVQILTYSGYLYSTVAST